MVKSAPLVVKALPNVRLILAGYGPEKEKLVNLIKDMRLEEFFIIKEEVEFNRVPVYINVFDIAILFFKPIRRNRGNPIKLFEYLACGKPVIATDIENYGKLLERYSAGIAVDSENPRAVAEAIILLAGDGALRKQMGERARQTALSEFTWQKTAQTIERLLKEQLI